MARLTVRRDANSNIRNYRQLGIDSGMIDRSTCRTTIDVFERYENESFGY